MGRKTSQVIRSAVSLAKGKRDYAQDLALKYDAGLSSLTAHRKWLLPGFIVGLIATGIVWIVALRFPHAIAAIYANGFNSNLPSRYSNLLSLCLMSVPFAPAFVSAFALGNMLFPTAPDPNIAVGIMSSFEYGQRSIKHWHLFIIAGLFGGLNCLLLLIAVMTASGN